jgi:hypothetical protein
MWHFMKRTIGGMAAIFILTSFGHALASELLTNPVVMITPIVLDFGLVKAGSTATNTLLVENAGGGKLVGKASVAAPFKIISGGSYSLKENTAQVVTITYTAGRSTADTQTVMFTGGGGGKVNVTGRSTGLAASGK